MGRKSAQFAFLPVFALAAGVVVAPSRLAAQGPPPQPPPGQAVAAPPQTMHDMHDMQKPTSGGAMSEAELNDFAKIFVAVGRARDSTQAQLAMAKNKKDIVQQQLRDRMTVQVDTILKAGHMTYAEYEHKTFVISSDSTTRRNFDLLVSKITGVPLLATTNLTSTPGAGAAAGPAIKLPAGAAGVHVGHVISAFGDTPRMMGLLPTAMADAKVAATHAALAAKDPNNLEAMKLHAGHVINAIDPTIVDKGPGSGYGVKKASLGVVTHIELAAKAGGASQNVITHANHIATSARNTAQWCDEAVAIAQKIQASTSASDAAGLVNQLISVTAQLTTGVDKNGDGRITWEAGEGGLQQADEHMKLLLAGEK